MPRPDPGSHRRLRVAMLGPARNVRGGVSAVVNALLGAMPADGPSVRYIPTHVDGPRVLKACAALVGIARLASAIVFWRCDIVHVHMGWRASFVRKSTAARLARAFGRSTVVHVHGSDFDVFFDNASPRVRAAITRTLERADLVVALSEEWRTRLLRMAPRARVRVLTNPVAASEFRRAFESRRPVPEGGGTVLFLGAFGARKGVYELLDAARAVRAERPGVLFELGGDQNVGEVERLIAEKGLGENVRLLGWVRGEEKLSAFARAHLFALPSHHEGLPMAVLEALAAGLPVVTTPVGGIPEAVRDGENGYLVRPGDVGALSGAILRLLGDPGLRDRMARANVEAAMSRHDATAVAARLAAWYHEVGSVSERGTA